ncbi:MAG: hypothetical protein OXF06_06480 [Bacteroidetes bacterium]|nr:hypothetical protein [Bacteroidota bacterium]MCY4224469.1 hypothetical protein [Bacteroidota bacterium]
MNIEYIPSFSSFCWSWIHSAQTLFVNNADPIDVSHPLGKNEGYLRISHALMTVRDLLLNLKIRLHCSAIRADLIMFSNVSDG